MSRSNHLSVGGLDVIVHRTVRVPDGRQPSQLPPSLGGMELYPVSEFRDKCPENWEDEAVFAVIWPHEALWMSFAAKDPVAVICGCGGLNAINAEKLELKLKEGNYMVAPGQPWIDGWKGEDGNVYQFVGTFYEQGKGNTVAEQVLGEESKSGAIGLATFKFKGGREGYQYPDGAIGGKGGWLKHQFDDPATVLCSTAPQTKGIMRGMNAVGPQGASGPMGEMGVGKGGKIVQKIYPDKNGVEAWETEPSGVKAIYLVDATTFAEITGQTAPPSPVSADDYEGPWYGLQDQAAGDVQGSETFTGLNSVFHQSEKPAEAAAEPVATSTEPGQGSKSAEEDEPGPWSA